MRDAFAEIIIDRMSTDRRIVLIDGDVANSTKTDRVFHAFPERFVAAGIAEQNMAGVAAGLATTGLRPFVVTFAVFAVSRMLDQVRMTIAQTGLPVVVVGAYAGLLTGKTGKTHISVDDIAVYRALPGMRVLSPADEVELADAIDLCLERPMPTYLRIARDAVPVVVSRTGLDPDGAPRILRSGTEIMLVSTGSQTGRCVAAADALREQGLDVGVVHVPQLKPTSPASLRDAVSPASLVITVEEHNVVGGLGGLVAESLTGAPWAGHLVRLGINERFGESGSNEDLLKEYGLSAERVQSVAMAAWSSVGDYA